MRATIVFRFLPSGVRPHCTVRLQLLSRIESLEIQKTWPAVTDERSRGASARESTGCRTVNVGIIAGYALHFVASGRVGRCE
jgi:hypothetical protein